MFGGRFSLLKSSSNWPPERAVSIPASSAPPSGASKPHHAAKWNGVGKSLGVSEIRASPAYHRTAILTCEPGIQAALSWMLAMPGWTPSGTRKFT